MYTYCDEESVNHLLLDCIVTKQLFSCFEKQYKLTNKLIVLGKMLGIYPENKRPKLIMKKLGILRRMIYQCNHKDEKQKWGNFSNKLINATHMSM